jgi:hypothetical protein
MTDEERQLLEKDKRFTDIFLPEIKAILGQQLIGSAPIEDDRQRNTDLIVLKMDSVRIACRLRRADRYLAKYGNQFTIRVGRPTGIKTELTKIIEGWGDYFFYAFGDEQTQALAKWTLADLKVFRGAFARRLVERNPLPPLLHNGDNSSTFYAFKWSDYPADLVVASSMAKIPACNQEQLRLAI